MGETGICIFYWLSKWFWWTTSFEGDCIRWSLREQRTCKHKGGSGSLFLYSVSLYHEIPKLSACSCSLNFPLSGMAVRKMLHNLQCFWEKVKPKRNISSKFLSSQKYLEIIHLTERSAGKNSSPQIWVSWKSQTMEILIASELHFWKNLLYSLSTNLPLKWYQLAAWSAVVWLPLPPLPWNSSGSHPQWPALCPIPRLFHSSHAAYRDSPYTTLLCFTEWIAPFCCLHETIFPWIFCNLWTFLVVSSSRCVFFWSFTDCSPQSLFLESHMLYTPSCVIWFTPFPGLPVSLVPGDFLIWSPDLFS